MSGFTVMRATKDGTPTSCSICGKTTEVVVLPLTRKPGSGGAAVDLWFGICVSCVEQMRRAFVFGVNPS
jgi:hypothetical protein